MVSKRSEYRRQFKISSLEKNIPVYYEHVSYRNSRREREAAHTPFSWDGDDDEMSSARDSPSSPEEEVPVPVSDLKIDEEEEEEEEQVEKEKKAAQQDQSKDDIESNDVQIIQQSEGLRNSAKEKLKKYASPENKDVKAAKCTEKRKQFGKTIVKPKKVDEKTFVKRSKPQRPDRRGKIPPARPTSAPASRPASTDASKPVPFVAYGCESRSSPVGSKQTFNVRASSAVYPAALRAQKRNQLQIEKLQERQRSASSREKRKKALFNAKMSRETAAWDTEYRKNFPAYSNTVYASSDKSPRKQKSFFIT